MRPQRQRKRAQPKDSPKKKAGGKGRKRQRKSNRRVLDELELEALRRATAIRPTFSVRVPLDLVPASGYLVGSVIDGISAVAIQLHPVKAFTPAMVPRWMARTINLRMALQGVATLSISGPELRHVSDEAVTAIARLNRAVADVYWSLDHDYRNPFALLALRTTGSFTGDAKVNLNLSLDATELTKTIIDVADPTSRRRSKEELRHLEEMNKAKEWKEKQEIADRDLDLATKNLEFANKQFKELVERLQLMVSLGAMSPAEMAQALREAAGLKSAALDSADALRMSLANQPIHQLPPGR